MREFSCDVAVIGAGPAGLAAASRAAELDCSTLLIEREERPGGILKQCIHDGFGLIRYKERLTGPEYADRELKKLQGSGVRLLLSSYILEIHRRNGRFCLKGSSPKGLFQIEASSLILACGCRERSARQIFLQGTRPSGVYTAGLAQYMMNIQGYMPTRRCCILGSGDIGLIMARRLYLEGAEVEGVYEIQPEPSGLPRNISQCLDDFGIPLYLSTTVLQVFGRDRLEGCEIAQLDEGGAVIDSSRRWVNCDALILSVGLIPENELALALGAVIDPKTGGCVVDSRMMSSVEGLFSCGNALQVSDLVDYVSESGEIAGAGAVSYVRNSSGDREIELCAGDGVRSLVPHRIVPDEECIVSFRCKKSSGASTLSVYAVNRNGKRVLIRQKRYAYLRPAEMERCILSADELSLPEDTLRIEVSL